MVDNHDQTERAVGNIFHHFSKNYAIREPLDDWAELGVRALIVPADPRNRWTGKCHIA